MTQYLYRYNTEADGGDIHDNYYAHRAVLWPATAKRKPGERYEEGAALYGTENWFLYTYEFMITYAMLWVGSLGHSYGDGAARVEALNCYYKVRSTYHQHLVTVIVSQVSVQLQSPNM